MRVGIHLPHIGRKAGPEAIRRAAIQAEELGFADVWTSEHIIIPKGAPYPPSAVFYDPVLTLTWAAAFTRRVGLGTSVLVLPMRHPLPLAKELATLQNLSRGPADPRRRGRLDGGRVRRARRAVPRARPAHGRGHRDDAGGVERGPGQLSGAPHPGGDRGHAHAAEAGQADPDLDRRQLRGGARPRRKACRRLARLAAVARRGRADRAPVARAAARAGIRDLAALRVGRQGRRRTPRPAGRLWRSRRRACSGRAGRARARGLAARRRARRRARQRGDQNQ